MKYIAIFLMVIGCVFANNIELTCTAKDNGNMGITVKLPESLDGKIWDTYMYYTVDGQKHYITLEGSSTERKALGMLPQQMELAVHNWPQDSEIIVNVEVCKSNTREVLSSAKCKALAADTPAAFDKKASIEFVQKVSDEQVRWYTDYKQFDSKWKYDKMGQHNGTTIGKDGCAMSAAANIINWTPRDLNNRLKSNGGYQNNLIIWSKVPYLSYSGKKSLSSSLFSSYHVIGYVGGHFVLLTGAKSGGYGSHDPGKSSNPVYSSGQIYSTRCYSK